MIAMAAQVGQGAELEISMRVDSYGGLVENLGGWLVFGERRSLIAEYQLENA